MKEEENSLQNSQQPEGSSPSDQYTAESIKVLEGFEAVRKRPAMYIGSTDSRGLHHLVYEVVDNSIDEALGGFCDRIEVIIHLDNSVTVIDNGRGIPVDMHPTEKRSAAEVVMTTLHAGGKFDHNTYKVSGGLHGVGVSVVNALSERLELEIWRDKKVYYQKYERGVPIGSLEVVGKTTRTGTKVVFLPDSSIFETVDYSFDLLSNRLRELAFLNKGICISIEDERTGKKHEFQYKGGISSFVEYLNKNRATLYPKPIYISGEKENIVIEIALQHNDGYAENIFTFANNINTQEGGTHLVGFKSALTRTVNNFAANSRLMKSFKSTLEGERLMTSDFLIPVRYAVTATGRYHGGQFALYLSHSSAESTLIRTLSSGSNLTPSVGFPSAFLSLLALLKMVLRQASSRLTVAGFVAPPR